MLWKHRSRQNGTAMSTISERRRLLVVEDEHDIASLIRHTLERTGDFEVQTAFAGDTAVKAAIENPPDLMILDLNLPILDGIEVFRTLRARPQTATIPVIMLTCRTSEDDRVKGLEFGADDYMVKPFSLRELVARVRTLLRRSQPPNAAAAVGVYRGRHLFADFEAVSVNVDGQPVRLTRREFELLQFLVTNRNRVVSRDRLLERVWGYAHEIETRSVDVHVGRLRAKLRTAGEQIETLIGLGYRFAE
jgi:DNA-binding response OmpR family regulator